jgi:hypothetical protein
MSAFAQQPTIFNEQRMLKHLGSECRGAKSCRPVKVGRLDLPAGQQQITTFQCPPGVPYFVGWDTSQHEHIRTLLMTQPPGNDDPSSINSRATILAENRGTTSGHVAIFLGCSSDPGRPQFLMHEIAGIPSSRTQTSQPSNRGE